MGSMDERWQASEEQLPREYRLDVDGIHGPKHWRRVHTLGLWPLGSRPSFYRAQGELHAHLKGQANRQSECLRSPPKGWFEGLRRVGLAVDSRELQAAQTRAEGMT